jgi:hypothetical protein
MTLETASRPETGTPPPLQFGLPHDGLILRVPSSGQGLSDLVWLAIVVATLIATTGSAIAAAGALGAVASLVFGAIVAGFVARYWRRHYGTRAQVTIDRAGIHDAAAGLPPLEWTDIESLEAVPNAAGVLGLYARLTPEANHRRFAGLAGLLRVGLSAQAQAGVVLEGTSADRLPIPLEYLILQLRARGAPVRAPAADFDPFAWDARWLPAPTAAGLIAERLCKRARPFAAHNLDLARTRGQAAGVRHWQGVLAELRKAEGLPADATAEDGDEI